MTQPKVSLIASSVRPDLYESLFKSLEGTSVEVEVVFAGNSLKSYNLKIEDIKVAKYIAKYDFFKYIPTANIKPAQCYEIARRHATGETILWMADDCEFPNDVIGKAYKFWELHNNKKLIVSIQTKESGYGMPEGKLFNMDSHRFFGYNKRSPLMAPLGLINREFLEELGGFDRRYICGQYENECVMRAYAVGGSVKIFGDEDCFIDIDHLGKSIKIGESVDEQSFTDRPFAKGYSNDRAVLENTWRNPTVKNIGERKDDFEPYEDEDILTKSQSNNLDVWE